MHNGFPFISVIIATFNSARFVTAAIRSVLDQTYTRYEVIVVDDGSIDDTKEQVVHQFPDLLRYFYQDNRGPSAARNVGIRHAHGEYICFLDADDLWSPNKLELQLEFLQDHPDIGLVFSDEQEISAGATRHSLLATSRFYYELIDPSPLCNAFRKLLIENFIPTSTVMVRKACFANAGLFDENLRVVEDRDLWLRMAAHFKIACLPLVLGKKLEHEANISANSELNLRSRLKVWKKMRRLFPSMTPNHVINGLSAGANLQLGYILAAKDQCKEAREAGIRSLVHAIRLAFTKGSIDASIPAYNWALGLGLLPLTFLGWSKTRSLLRHTSSVLSKS